MNNNIIQWAESNFKHITLDKGLINIQLMPSHKHVLTTCVENDKTIVLGARQVGKTTLCNLFSLWYAINFDNKKIKYYTVSFRHISYLIDSIRLAFDNIQLADKPVIIKQSDTSIDFSNGSSIELLTFDQLVDNTIADCVICDEIAFSAYNVDVDVFKSIPKVIIMSSAFKNKGIFYKIWNLAQNSQDDWKSCMIKWDDVHTNIHTQQWKHEMIDLIGIKAWKHEFECEFIEEE